MKREPLFTFAGFVVFFTLFFLPAEIGKLMASGDALVESLPALLGAHHLWEPTIFLGYPLYADPNQQLWYPLARLVTSVHVYNAFAVAPFPIAAFGVWGLVRSATGSSLAGIVSGFTYALGGFLISHAGHLMVSHPAAWAPYVLWSIEAQRSRANGLALGGGALALGLCALAGQPEVFAFTMPLAIAFAVVSARSAIDGPRAFATRVALTILTGIGLAAVQLVPEAVLAHASTRSSIDFSAFTLYQIPVSQFAMRAMFPFAFGTTTFAAFPYSRFDLGTYTEDTIGVGSAALVLAVLSQAAYVRDRRVAFWAAVAAVAFLLAIGDATPLARITHVLPVYGLLRIPGRHAFEWTLALAVLAGYGTQAILRDLAGSKRTAVAIGIVTAFTLVAYAQFTFGAMSNAGVVAAKYAVDISRVVSPFANGALGMPLAFGAASIVLLCFGMRLRRSPIGRVLLAIAVAVDCGAAAYPAYWNFGAVTTEALEPPPSLSLLSRGLASNATRLAFAADGTPTSIAPPNLTLLWKLPIADGYTPLLPKRTAELLTTAPSAGLPVPGSRDASLDLAGVSVLALPAAPGTPFHLFVSKQHAEAPSHADFGFPIAMPATSLRVISDLGDSIDVPQDAVVASLTVVFANGTSERHDLRAGVDTSEFAFDRPDVRPNMKHRRAKIFSSYGPGHTYVATFPVSSKAPVTRVELDWTYPTAALTLEQLSLIDARSATTRTFDSQSSLYAFPGHWKPIPFAAPYHAFRNARAMPQAWFARPAGVVESEAAYAVHYGKLSDGKDFSASRNAAVEGDFAGVVTNSPADRITVDRDDETAVSATATCASACFAVFRDAFDNADWRADIDGAPVTTYATDVDLRGVNVPAGAHTIRFRFFPLPLYLGALISAISAIAVLTFAVVIRSRALRAS